MVMETKNIEAIFKKNLSKWLDQEDNRFYEVWSSKTCNIYTVERDDKTLDAFLNVLKRHIGLTDIEKCGFTVRPHKFTIHFDGYDVEIDGYDSMIIHTKDFKEDIYE